MAEEIKKETEEVKAEEAKAPKAKKAPAKKAAAKKTATKKAPAKKAAAKKTEENETKTEEVKEEAKPVETKAEAPKAEEKKEEVKEYITRPVLLKDMHILKHLIVSEETQRLEQKENALVFAVDRKATKTEIKGAVEAIFHAKVKSVNTMNLQPKTRRVGRYEGKLPVYKKAIVRFDSAYDLGKITAATANEERKANDEAK